MNIRKPMIVERINKTSEYIICRSARSVLDITQAAQTEENRLKVLDISSHARVSRSNNVDGTF